MKRCCGTCNRLPTCDRVTPSRLESDYACDGWEVAQDTDLKAREIIIQDFGPWALGYEAREYCRNQAESAKPKHQRRRKKNHG